MSEHTAHVCVRNYVCDPEAALCNQSLHHMEDAC